MAALTGPVEPVSVAVLARTSNLVLQDPAASLRRQITSAREWLPGFYVAGYYWDVESGALDLEQRGHGHYEQFTSQGIPRDGGLADLLAEARSPNPRFAAVVVEDIERASRDFCCGTQEEEWPQGALWGGPAFTKGRRDTAAAREPDTPYRGGAHGKAGTRVPPRADGYRPMSRDDPATPSAAGIYLS